MTYVVHIKNWMKFYIMLNTRLKTAAKNDFEKNFLSL